MTPTLEHLLNFGVVVLVQLIFFIVHSIAVGEGRTILKHLGQGILLGLPFGIVFDLVVGKGLGMYEYELGFTLWFLIINGIFSFGFMVANVRLLYQHTLYHMYAWSVGLAIIYEIVNYFFPVWKWTFITSTALEYAVVVLLAYAGITALMMITLRIIYRVHFRPFQF